MKNTISYSFKLFISLLFAAFAGVMLFISFGVIFADLPMWVMALFTQVFGLAVVITMIWQTVYIIGFKDSNMVKTGHIPEQKSKGFIIGALAQIPFAVFNIVAMAINMRYGIYRLIYGAYYWFVTVIAGGESSINAEVCMRDLGVTRNILMFLPLLIVPAVSGAVYLLGYKGIDIKEKLIYKKRSK